MSSSVKLISSNPLADEVKSMYFLENPKPYSFTKHRIVLIKTLCLMHVVSLCIVRRYFSVESGQACITGLVNALSDHFTSFFVT